MKQYECDLCGYVYDEAAGDPDNGIAPGTKWEDFFFAQSGIRCGKRLSGPSVRGLWAGPAAAGSPE